MIVTERSLADAERLDVVYRPSAGRWPPAPAPWLLALLLVCILSVLWFFAVSRFMNADEWGEERSARADEG